MEGNNNLLAGGIDTLNEIKENLLELHGYQTKFDALLSEEDNLEKDIRNLEKSISEEIADTTKNRRQEIESTFDKQSDKTLTRIKRTREKREKRKSSKISERIDAETLSLREENNQLSLETKTILKQKHVPAWCNTKLYYALYFPKGFMDILFIILALFLTLFVIPCGVYFYLLPVERIFYLILIYIITVICFGGLFLLVYNRTKERHRETLVQVKGLRDRIRINKKKMGVIKRSILKDNDESTYGLENFDEELSRLNKEAEDIAEQKKEALLLFDNTTSQVIAGEIRGRFDEKLSSLKAEYEKKSAEIAKTGEKIKALTIKTARDYEPFIGKDLMSLERLDSLINIIQAGNAANISEAIKFYKQNTDQV